MKNIERKYAYHDDGVLPAIGEDGVTYLTLYSSNAGNTYDGWIWDPDRVHYSETERTFGYRYPGDENYCWDDEVTVDLSNAQNRQESSEYETGRITSFNTNVSKFPIVLQDVDVTGLTEEERESKATMVLFTAIPLIKSAYIHGEIEISMKMNISPDNTDGNVRVEAFYILNDESDRTMRPNPVNHYTVTKVNEYHTMRLLYYNPAVNHEQNNYIGVKLVVSGGTAEIGISDDPDYGDAIITVASNGMDGDRVFESKPSYLELRGKEYVPCGYKLNLDDYTVLCHYDGGEVYDVTRLCTFNPSSDTPIIDSPTTLTAYYMDLDDSMELYLANVLSIELSGLTDVYGQYFLNIDDYTVIGHFDNDDDFDVTDQCSFNPIMGTEVTQDITLEATYTPDYMSGSEFTDILNITKHSGEEPVTTGGLIYTLYDDNTVEITGDADIYNLQSSLWNNKHECVRIPIEIIDELVSRGANYKVRWNAKGTISGVNFGREYSDGPLLVGLENFGKVKIKPEYFGRKSLHLDWQHNEIVVNFNGQSLITSSGLGFLSNIDFTDVENVPTALVSMNGDPKIYLLPSGGIVTQYFGCSSIFYNCTSLDSIYFVSNWDTSSVTTLDNAFRRCTNLHSVKPLSKWNVHNVYSAEYIFSESGITSCEGLSNWNLGSTAVRDGFSDWWVRLTDAFSHCNNLRSLSGLEYFIKNKNHKYSIPGIFEYCENLSNIDAISTWWTAKIINISWIFDHCRQLTDIHALAGWDCKPIERFNHAFRCTGVPSAISLMAWEMGDSVGTETSLMFGCDWRTMNADGYQYLEDDLTAICDCSSLNSWYDDTVSINKYLPVMHRTIRIDDTDIDVQFMHTIYIQSRTQKPEHFEGWFIPSHGASQSSSGASFAGIDAYCWHVRSGDDDPYAPFVVYIYFLYSNKLPAWYKNTIAQCERDVIASSSPSIEDFNRWTYRILN